MLYQINSIPNNNKRLLDQFCSENFVLLRQKGIVKVLAIDVAENLDNSIIIDTIEEIEGKILNNIALPKNISRGLYSTIKKWKPRLIHHTEKPYFAYLAYNKCRYGTVAIYFPNSSTLYTANLIESNEGQELLKRIIEHIPDRKLEEISVQIGANIEFDCMNSAGKIINPYSLLQEHLKEIPVHGKDDYDEYLEAMFKDYPYTANYLEIGLNNNFEHLVFRPEPSEDVETLIERLRCLFQFCHNTLHCGLAINEAYSIHIQFFLGFQYEPDDELLNILDYFISKDVIKGDRETLYDDTGYGFEIILPSTKIASHPKYLKIFLKVAKSIVQNYLNAKAFAVNEYRTNEPTKAEYFQYCGFSEEYWELLNEFKEMKIPKGNIIENWIKEVKKNEKED